MQKILMLSAALLLSFAAAHATVRTEAGTSQSAAGKSETYRLNVPVENDMATTQVRLEVPAGVGISRFEVTPGFARTVSENADGLVTEVVWKGNIEPMEYARFFFQAKNPEAAGELIWKVYQTYADGSVVAWDDTQPDKTPASHTIIK